MNFNWIMNILHFLGSYMSKRKYQKLINHIMLNFTPSEMFDT